MNGSLQLSIVDITFIFLRYRLSKNVHFNSMWRWAIQDISGVW